jgi:hypothetical protein
VDGAGDSGLMRYDIRTVYGPLPRVNVLVRSFNCRIRVVAHARTLIFTIIKVSSIYQDQ